MTLEVIPLVVFTHHFVTKEKTKKKENCCLYFNLLCYLPAIYSIVLDFTAFTKMIECANLLRIKLSNNGISIIEFKLINFTKIIGLLPDIKFKQIINFLLIEIISAKKF